MKKKLFRISLLAIAISLVTAIIPRLEIDPPKAGDIINIINVVETYEDFTVHTTKGYFVIPRHMDFTTSYFGDLQETTNLEFEPGKHTVQIEQGLFEHDQVNFFLKENADTSCQELINILAPIWIEKYDKFVETKVQWDFYPGVREFVAGESFVRGRYIFLDWWLIDQEADEQGIQETDIWSCFPQSGEGIGKESFFGPVMNLYQIDNLEINISTEYTNGEFFILETNVGNFATRNILLNMYPYMSHLNQGIIRFQGRYRVSILERENLYSVTLTSID